MACLVFCVYSDAETDQLKEIDYISKRLKRMELHIAIYIKHG